MKRLSKTSIIVGIISAAFTFCSMYSIVKDVGLVAAIIASIILFFIVYAILRIPVWLVQMLLRLIHKVVQSGHPSADVRQLPKWAQNPKPIDYDNATALDDWSLYWPESVHNTQEQQERIERAATQHFEVVSMPDSFSAVMIGSSGQEYHVTLEDCSCPDFQRRQLPCKHMYSLASRCGLFDLSSHLTTEAYRPSNNNCDFARESIAQCKREFIAFDVETTGLNPSSDRIVELSAIRYRNFTRVNSFTTLVFTNKKISQQASKVNGITNADLADAPSEEEVMRSLCGYLGEGVLRGEIPMVAHNARFDCGFLSAAMKRCGIVEYTAFEDTLALARTVMPNLGSYKLGDLAQELGIQQLDGHRAEDDARVCGEIFIALVEMMIDAIGKYIY